MAKQNLKFRAWNRKTQKFVYDVLIENGGTLGQAHIHSSEGFGGMTCVRKHPDAKDIEITFEEPEEGDEEGKVGV